MSSQKPLRNKMHGKCYRYAWSPLANLQNRCFVYTKPPFSRMTPNLQNCEFGPKDWLIGRISAPEMQIWDRNCLKIGRGYRRGYRRGYNCDKKCDLAGRIEGHFEGHFGGHFAEN